MVLNRCRLLEVVFLSTPWTALPPQVPEAPSRTSALFMENGQFEPSHRGYLAQMADLKTQPDDFAGRFESFLRPDSELPPARKYEIAKLIARSIVNL